MKVSLLALWMVVSALPAFAQQDDAGAPAPRPTPDVDALEPAVSFDRDPPAPAAERAPAVPAPDRLDLGTTSITGHQELPKVLYIVPWKRSDLGDLVGRPVNTLLDEALAPLDPDVFSRHVNYYDALYEIRQEE